MKNKNFLLVLIMSAFFSNCQKEMSDFETQVQKNEQKVRGEWKFVAYIDSNHIKTTSANECYADDRFYLRESGVGVISQGNCMQFPDKPRDVEFAWRFISENVIDIGGDVVTLTVFNDSTLQFKRTLPSYLEYHWKR
jgi:hypothetical protein